MKVGIRKPSIKRSIKARTTGKLKRQIKKSVNPFYGKKGMGLVNDPKKAVYNKVYNKTTVGVNDLIKTSHTSPKSHTKYSDVEMFFACLFGGWFGLHKFMEKKIGMGFIYMFTVGLCGIGWIVDCCIYGSRM